MRRCVDQGCKGRGRQGGSIVEIYLGREVRPGVADVFGIGNCGAVGKDCLGFDSGFGGDEFAVFSGEFESGKCAVFCDQAVGMIEPTCMPPFQGMA